MKLTDYGKNPATMDSYYMLTVDRRESDLLGHRISGAVVELVAKELAARFLEERGTEVLTKISAEAVATMAIAEAGAAVNDTLKRKLPDKILEIVREAEPVVLQRGLFGGIRRIR